MFSFAEVIFKRLTKAILYLFPARCNCVVNPSNLAFPKVSVSNDKHWYVDRQRLTDVSYQEDAVEITLAKPTDEPLSRKANRYIKDNIGISHKSIFRYSFLSCSGVSLGEGKMLLSAR